MSLKQKHLAWRQWILLALSESLWYEITSSYETTNRMAPDRGKPQNYREYFQHCPLVLYMAVSGPAISERLVQNIKIRTNCTWFMAAQLKHRILWSGEHLLMVHRDLCHVYDDVSSPGCLMGEEEELMPIAQLLSHKGWDALESKMTKNVLQPS